MVTGDENGLPTPIQVVFQGGGAKLCLLMAVADVLQQYQAAGRIQVKRVAGSSAGAIVAVMLASSKPISTYKAQLKSIAPKYLEATKSLLVAGVWRVFSGQPYFARLNLENFFGELFLTRDGPKLLNDLDIKDSRIYFTDLYSLASRAAPDDEPIPQALARSCRFPFAFVGFGSGNTQVDGGLALNLPVDQLKKDESTMGSVIAISFANKFGSTEKSNLLSYTQQLFSAAIQSGVTRSEMILGRQNVYSIDTEIGTFDFEEALDTGLGLEYDLVSNKFETWLAGWLKSYGPIESVSPGGKHKLLRPGLADTPWSPAIVHELNDRLQSEPSTRAKSAGCFDTALLDEAGRFTGKYVSRSIKTFEVIRPTNVLQFDFQIGRGTSFAGSNLGCAVLNSQGDALAFISHVEELTKDGDPLRTFRVYFLFERPLTPTSPNQPYRAEYQHEADDPYPNLASGADASTLSMRQGDAAEAILCVAFPRAIVGPAPIVTDVALASPSQQEKAKYPAEDEVFAKSDFLALFDFVDSMALNNPVDSYFLVGCRARNISLGQTFGFVIEKQAS
jgi:predicted acylesterase/phospholipase RssA